YASKESGPMDGNYDAVDVACLSTWSVNRRNRCPRERVAMAIARSARVIHGLCHARLGQDAAAAHGRLWHSSTLRWGAASRRVSGDRAAVLFSGSILCLQ